MASSILSLCFPCARGRRSGSASSDAMTLVEKEPLLVYRPRYTSIQARELAQVLLTTQKSGAELVDELDDIVRQESWTDWLAEQVLHAIEDALRRAEELGPTIRQAHDNAIQKGTTHLKMLFQEAMEHKTEIAVGLVVTVLAIGVLVVMAPWALEALGFAELGPVEGSFAALWQSRYAGYVPKGSLWSYLQRLGMTWGKA